MKDNFSIHFSDLSQMIFIFDVSEVIDVRENRHSDTMSTLMLLGKQLEKWSTGESVKIVLQRYFKGHGRIMFLTTDRLTVARLANYREFKEKEKRKKRPHDWGSILKTW